MDTVISKTLFTRNSEMINYSPPTDKHIGAYHATRAEFEWLTAMLKSGETSRIITITLITPGIASLMLEHNTRNRHISQSQVKIHVGRLENGKAILTHQGIAFSKTGELGDGQHRLTSIIRSGISWEMMITFGAEPEEMNVADNGRSRTAGDKLSIDKKSYANVRASVARILLESLEGQVFARDPQRVVGLAEELSQEDDIFDRAIISAGALTGSGQKTPRPSTYGAAYYHIAKNSPNADRVDEFLSASRMRDGDNLGALQAKLRNWLIQNSVSRKKKDKEDNLPRKIIREERASLYECGVIVVAWNSFIKGKKTFDIDCQFHGKLPKPE